MLKTFKARPTLVALACSMALTSHAMADAPKRIEIPAGDLVSALETLSRQAMVDLVFRPDQLKSFHTEGVSGTYSSEDAVRLLLKGTPLELRTDSPSGAMVIAAPTAPKSTPVSKTEDGARSPLPRFRIAQSDAPEGARPSEQSARGQSVGTDGQRSAKGDSSSAAESTVKGVPEILVRGDRTLNTDIARTPDDPQPYVVFNREQLERSGASSVEQFLQQRLPMSTGTINFGGVSGITSQIRLRGLSATQTLILVDGHRMASPSYTGYTGGGDLGQADISGIPLSSVERIEVLPTTASGIYGGSATGGVINIVLRRYYSGAEVKLTYGNTFDSDASNRKADLTFGQSFNGGRTSVLFNASYSSADALLQGERDFQRRGQNAMLKNNPGYFLPPNPPPLASTPNISSTNGQNLVLDNGTVLGSSFTSVPAGYAGIASDGGAALLGRAGVYEYGLPDSAQYDVRGGGLRQGLFSQPTVKSAGVVLRQEINEGLQVFADLSGSWRDGSFLNGGTGSATSYVIPAAAANNPFLQDIRVTVPLPGTDSDLTTESKQYRALLGLTKRLAGEWSLSADYTWERTRIIYATGLAAPGFATALSAGSIDVLRDTSEYPIDIAPYQVLNGSTSPFESTMKDANLRVSGPVGQLPGGAITVSAAAEYRRETTSDSFNILPAYNLSLVYPKGWQSVGSAYVEARFPFFSAGNARPGVQELELQTAVRRDKYDTTAAQRMDLSGPIPATLPPVVHSKGSFASTDPTIALKWKPIQDVAMRVSYGTGFLPPSLSQMLPTVSPTLSTLPSDPLRGGTIAGPFTTISGGNPALKPEESESWSGGLILTPRVLPGTRLSVDYTRLKKTDNIGGYPGSFQGIVNDAALFPNRVVRGPNLPGDPAGWAGPIISVDNSYMNLATAQLEAIDAQLDVNLDTAGYGSFEIFAVASWQLNYETQVAKGSPPINNLGIGVFSPLKFKASTGLQWTSREWKVGWNASYFDSYLVSSTPSYIQLQGGDGTVPSQIYHDLYVNYDLGLAGVASKEWFGKTEIQLGIRNVFNKKPPFDAYNYQNGFYSQLGDPRLASWYLSLTTRL
ncbi:MAG: TonB-dependent receptor [Gammaproteobacteria bacterium]